MNIGLALRLVLSILILSYLPVHGAVLASTQARQLQEAAACEREMSGFVPLTLNKMREKAVRAHENIRRFCPAPNHSHIEIAKNVEQIADPYTTRFMDWLLPDQTGMVAAPVDSSPDPASVGIIDRMNTYPIWVKTKLKHRTVTTTAYITEPGRLKNKSSDKSVKSYPIDARHALVQVHLHGGGTKTTGAHSATETGEAIAGATGVPYLTFDLPGHSNATKDMTDLETGSKQIDLILKVIDELVDPNVKIAVYGHSWGAQFVIMMWQRRHEPRFKRFIEYIAGSPPPDPSMGGDPHEKVRFEALWERTKHEHYKDMAPNDMIFQDNVLENGKYSPVAAVALRLSDRDYQLPKMTWDDVQRGPRLTVIMGNKDGICYVGREKFFAESFPPEMFVNFADITDWQSFMSDPNRPSRFILLPDQKNFKTRREGEDVTQPTGHQIADFIIPGTINDKSSGKRFLWELLSRGLLAHHNQKVFPKNLEGTLDPMLNFIAMAKLRDFAARQLVMYDVEYVQTNIPEQHEAVRLRQKALTDYITAYDAVKRGEAELERKYVREELDALARRLGLGGGFSFSEAEQKIKAEPPDEASREVLHRYVDRRNDIEPQMRRPVGEGGWEDTASAAEEAAALSAAREALNQPEWTVAQFADLAQKAKRDKSVDITRDDRAALTTFAADVTRLNGMRSTRFSAERSQRIANLARATGAELDAIAARTGRSLEGDATRLALFYLEGAPRAIERARTRAQEDIRPEIAKLDLPSGTHSRRDVDAAYGDQRKILDMTYAPDDHPALRAIVAEIKAAEAAVRAPEKLAAEFNKVNEVRKYRQGQLTRFRAAWADREKVITSPRIAEYWGPRQVLRTKYRDAFDRFNAAAAEYELALLKKGELIAENIYASYDTDPELKRLRHEMETLEAEFMTYNAPIAEMQRQDSLDGKLIGDAEAVEFAIKAAREIWGEPQGNPPVENLTTRLRVMEDELEALREASSIAENQIGAKRMEYLKELGKANLAVPFKIHPVRIADLFNKMDPPDLVAAMTAKDPQSRVLQEALKKFRKRYTDMHIELSQINQGARDTD